jgi:hypothetical protein
MLDLKFKKNTLTHMDNATASQDISSIAGVSEFEVRGVTEDGMSAGGITNQNHHSNNH